MAFVQGTTSEGGDQRRVLESLMALLLNAQYSITYSKRLPLKSIASIVRHWTWLR